MPRPIWKGQISFGLVSIPVGLYSAESPSDGVALHLVDKNNHARVRNKRVNEKTGEPVEWNDIVKGYELDDGSYVFFTEEELDKLEAEANQSVEIEAFIEEGSIHRSFFSKPYFLIPEKRGRKGYLILREALRESGKVGIARVVLRTKQYLAAVAPEEEKLMLYLLRYGSELKEAGAKDFPSTAEEVGAKPAEVKIAQQLVEAMTTEWNPDDYKDEYKESLMKWIEEKSQGGGETLAGGEEGKEEAGEVIDIMSLLRESMAKAKTGSKSEPKEKKKA